MRNLLGRDLTFPRMGARRGPSGPPPLITATVTPSLGALSDGDTIASAMSANYDQASNYSSAAGTISTVVAAATVNGSPALFTDTVDAGDVVAVTVTVTDSEASERVFNAGSRTVAGIAPTNDVAPSIAGDTGLGDTLTVTAGTWSGAPAPTLAYQWLRGGVEIAGETGTTYDITLADSGAEITVRETATNSEGSASQVSNAITADTFTAPVNTVAPSIGGDTAVGSTLTRTAGTWSGNPTPTLSGQWQRDGADISGATGATYVTVEADEGADITYLETATNAVGSASQASNAITVTAASSFTPASLFASGEEGAWYEPSPTTAFLSTTNLTPCGVGDSVGFLPDKSQGAGYSGGAFTGLGGELVTNGGFATNDLTGWTDASSGGSVSVADEQVTLSRTAGTARLRQDVTTEIGKTYLFSFNLVSENPTNRAAIYAGSTTGGSDLLVPQIPTQGVNSYVLTATTTTIGLTFYTENTGFDPVFDNISVRELPGNHATQATAAARPVLQQTAGGVWHVVGDEVDDALNWTAPADTDYTISYVDTAGNVTTLTGQSLSGATNILLDPALVGYLAVDRALTAGETTDLETYWGTLA